MMELVLTRKGRWARSIALISHLDTVFPPEEEARNNFHWQVEGDRIRRFQELTLSDERAESLILRSFERGLVSYRALPDVIHEWRQPSFDYGSEPTLWRLFNAWTTVLGPVATGWTSDALARRAADADGASAVMEAHKAVGLHDAMYLIPALGVVLVAVLFAASRTVGRDTLRGPMP